MRAVLLALLGALMLAGCAGKGAKTSTLNASLEDERDAARLAWLYGDYSAVLENNLRILREEPENRDALLGAGEALLSLGNARQALPYFEAVLRKDGADIDALEGRALARLGLSRADEARSGFESVLERQPARWRSLDGMGALADLQGDYATAAGWYEKALKQAPEEATIYNNYGYSRIMARDFARAEELLERGVALAPRSERLVTNLSLAIAWQRDYERALRTGTQVQKDYVAYNDIGYVAMLNGDHDVAIRYFQQAIDKCPNWFTRAASNLERARRERAEQSP